MDYPQFEIGTKFDDKTGEPLFLVDGKLLGTVKEVKKIIADWEALQIETVVRNAIEEFDRTILPQRISQYLNDRRAVL